MEEWDINFSSGVIYIFNLYSLINIFFVKIVINLVPLTLSHVTFYNIIFEKCFYELGMICFFKLQPKSPTFIFSINKGKGCNMLCYAFLDGPFTDTLNEITDLFNNLHVWSLFGYICICKDWDFINTFGDWVLDVDYFFIFLFYINK